MNDFTKEELEWMNSRIFYGMEKASYHCDCEEEE